MRECEVYINPNTGLAQFRKFLGDVPAKVKAGEIIQFVEKQTYEKQLYGLAEIIGELIAEKKSLSIKLDAAIKALEFYANPDVKNTEVNNFIEPEMLNCELGTFIKEDFETMVGDDCYGDKRYGSFQGKIAREALKKIRG